jgi:hypothetical protein
MLFTKTVFIGIDPTAGKRPFVCAALDYDLQLIALFEGPIDEIMAFVGGQEKALIGITAPQSPNKGLMAKDEIRNQLTPKPRPGRWAGFRMVEYELRQRGINIHRTPGKKEIFPHWMQNGFALFRDLEKFGYKQYPSEEEDDRQIMEIYPHAAFTCLLERTPFPKKSLEGRLQRQLILHSHNLGIPDPMLVFEEITRHRLLKGVIPLDELYGAEELDALVAAYTAWMGATNPDKVVSIGDSNEGKIVLPVRELKSRYT